MVPERLACLRGITLQYFVVRVGAGMHSRAGTSRSKHCCAKGQAILSRFLSGVGRTPCTVADADMDAEPAPVSVPVRLFALLVPVSSVFFCSILRGLLSCSCDCLGPTTSRPSVALFVRVGALLKTSTVISVVLLS